MNVIADATAVNRRKQMLKKIIIGLLLTSSLFSQISDNNFFVFEARYVR